MAGDELEVPSPKKGEKDSKHTTLSVNRAVIDVEKFDGSNNFGMWRCEVMDALAAQDLDEVLAGKPDDLSGKDWSKLNKKACGLIRCCLARSIRYHVMSMSSAQEIWEFLGKKYLTKSIESRLHLKKRLYRFQMQHGTSLDEHLNDFTKLLADLLNLDVNVEDEDKALLLLNSLPDEYEHFVMTLIHGRETLDYDSVTSALIGNEHRRRDKAASKLESTSEVLMARGRGSGNKFERKFVSRSKSRVGKSQLAVDECAFCHEIGHWRRDCPKLQKGDKNGDKKSRDGVHVARKGGDDCDSDYSLLATSVASTSGALDWIFDSGCPYHLCPVRELFTSFQKLDGKILMGNNHACKIFGIGSIRLRMFDGSIRELKNVRYVPELQHNLISVGALADDGLRIVFRGHSLRVVSGALVVMKGTRREGNLFFLVGSLSEGSCLSASTVGNLGGCGHVWPKIGSLFGIETCNDLGHFDLEKSSHLVETDAAPVVCHLSRSSALDNNNYQATVVFGAPAYEPVVAGTPMIDVGNHSGFRGVEKLAHTSNLLVLSAHCWLQFGSLDPICLFGPSGVEDSKGDMVLRSVDRHLFVGP